MIGIGGRAVVREEVSEAEGVLEGQVGSLAVVRVDSLGGVADEGDSGAYPWK
jgi:hypothetical protein